MQNTGEKLSFPPVKFIHFIAVTYLTRFLSTTTVPANKSSAVAHIITQQSTPPMLAQRPATTYDNAAITATTDAYGSWVFTWLTWLHCAPAEARIVVSEMGEMWSPNTAPPRVAETVRMVSVPLPPRIVTAIGTRTPNVPQDVPVACKDKEYCREQELRECAVSKICLYKRLCIEISALSTHDARDRPREREDQNSGNHCLKSIGKAVCDLFERHYTSNHVIERNYKQSDG